LPVIASAWVLQELDGAADDRVVAFVLLPRHLGIDVSGARACLARPAADEVERGAAHALALGSLPDRLAAGAPGGVAGIAVIVAEAAFHRIDKDVRDDAVMLGPAACEEGRVVDDRDGREGRHEVARPGAFAFQAVEGRCVLRRIELRRSEAVEQDDNHGAFRRRCGSCGKQQRGKSRQADQQTLHTQPPESKRAGRLAPARREVSV